jgi:hypothetical protein
MPKIESIIRCELNPAMPVQELCALIAAVSTHQVNTGQEKAILFGLQDAISKRLVQINSRAEIVQKEGEPNDEQIHQSDGNQPNQ